MAEIHPLSFTRHGKKQLKPLASWEFTATQNTAPLLVPEFIQAAHNFPIVFLKQQEKFFSFALLGLIPETNQLLDKKNKWLVKYIPAVFRRYPFLMARTAKDKDEFVLCVDEASNLLADEGGAALFEEDGTKTATFEKAASFTVEIQKQTALTESFCQIMQELDLLVPYNITLRGGKKPAKLEGLFCISEEKLRALSDENTLMLHKRGIIPLVYAHLFSLAKVADLANINPAVKSEALAPPAEMMSSFNF